MIEMKEIVRQVLTDVPETRSNDLLLMAIVLKKMNKPTDLEELAQITSKNILESIRRCRQLTQQYNPFLAPAEKVEKARLKEQQKYYEEITRCM